MQCLKVSQVPKERRGALTLKGTPIHFTEQRTGLGIRQMFLCPHCGTERLKLFYTDGAFRCAGCLRNDPYRHRRNLYDNGGEKLITYKMQRLAATVGITIKWPFDYADYPFSRPKVYAAGEMDVHLEGAPSDGGDALCCYTWCPV